MQLKIVQPKDIHFKTGALARVFLNDVEVSQSVAGVDVHCFANAPISATVHFYLTGLEIDVPADLTGTVPIASA